METRNYSVFAGVAIVIIILVGAGGWYFGYQMGWNKAKALVTESGLRPSTETTQVTTLTGTVLGVEGNTIRLRVGVADPFAPKTLAERIVTIGETTTIEKLQVASATSSPVTLSDIKPNDFVTVNATEDIRTAQSFTAAKIILLPPMVPPPTATTTSPAR